ncbi:MAG: methionine--tRNA ligase [Patescibacteria group bacterium]
MPEKFYVTTPIYYVNDKPHIGHAYTTIAADVLARYHRLRGDDVFFLTGTDENSQKNVEAAAKHGQSDIRSYLDEMSAVWQKTWVDLQLTNDDFIRTTQERHLRGVDKFWKIVTDRGDIYEGEYEGLYCTGCEGFKLEGDLVDGLCPQHKKAPDRIKERNYFFRVTAYREALLKHIDEQPDFIQPLSRRNEVRSYIDKFMQDFSISRDVGAVKAGIPVPGDESQVIYVWFDALLNYMTAVGYGTDDELYQKWWPANVHLVGKDIIKFHCALWPAMLMSAGLPLPKKVFAHGFFTIDGDKMSKSLGNVIDPLDVAAKYGRDGMRYFLLKEITFGEDGDFSLKRLAERYQGDLGNDLGNLLHRTLSMTDKYLAGQVLCPETGVQEMSSEVWPKYDRALEELDFGGALETIWEILRWSNKYIDDSKPWVLAKEDPAKIPAVLYSLLERLRQVAWMLKPFMPETAEKMLLQLGIADSEAEKTYEQAKQWGGFQKNATIAKGEPLFPRLEE